MCTLQRMVSDLKSRPSEFRVVVTVDDDDDSPIRRDVESRQVYQVHPELVTMHTPEERNAHLQQCDSLAYSRICDKHPNFKPPHQRRESI